MSFVDLATLTLHRRNELEARINVFLGKCDHAISDIQKLKAQAQSFVGQLNCDPAELKERFLRCMKQLDEFTYLVTDFNLAVGKLEENNTSEYTPVHDNVVKASSSTPHATLHFTNGPTNLMDVLSEPTPSTSAACPNHCPSEKPKRMKVPKEDQVLIAFSSSSSSESVPQSKSGMVAKEVQCELTEDVKNLTITCPSSTMETCNLPAQQMLQVDQVYPATIMSVDEDSFWLITDSIDDVYKLMVDMTEFYKSNHVDMTLEDVASLTYCSYYDESSDCFYRTLFIRILEEDLMAVELFLVDTGEMRTASVGDIQPLLPQFCRRPPAARCCHLAGIDLLSYHDKSLLEKQDQFMKEYVGTFVSIQIDDNSTSESLGVYVMLLPSKQILNDLLVQNGLAVPIDKPKQEDRHIKMGPPELAHSELDITQCPEYEDPVEAVTGYSNRDEAEICKHYKGGPEKTCFKGVRCTKRHVLKHPDGWTTDRVEVVAKLKSLPLPKPDTWHKVLVTCVCHFDRIYVQFVDENEKELEEKPGFGVILPPTTLTSLVQDMNSPAARMSYKPLKLTPAPGEIVAALYPMDNQWYRARVLTVTRADQNVEVMYVDYGNVVWVKEDQVRQLEGRFLQLPAQAVRCALAGVCARSRASAQWAAAKNQLAAMVQDRAVQAHVIGRDYDELIVDLYDDGYSVSEQLAALDMIELKEFSVHDDTHLSKRIVPA